jgi:hypothetical protein
VGSGVERHGDDRLAFSMIRVAMSRSLTFSRCDALTRNANASSSLHRYAAIRTPFAYSMTAPDFIAAASPALNSRASQ